MAKKKKNDSQDKTLKILVLATAVLNLIRAIIDIVDKFIE